MVTRNIKANTATQVNANLIGVGVHPYPSLISFNYHQTFVDTVSGDVYYIEGDNRPYMWHSGYRPYEGENYYMVQCAVRGQYIRYWYKGADDSARPEVGTQFYVMTSGNPVVFEKAGVCTGTDTLKKITFQITGPETGDYIPLGNKYQLNTATGEIDYNGSTVYLGNVRISSMPLTANFIGDDDNKYLFMSNDWPVTVYTEGRPVTGSEVHYPDDIYVTPESYVGDITYDSVSCTVSYSIDGVTFTQVEDTLTDANNVIANVPRYVYLKFSQDVEITEE